MGAKPMTVVQKIKVAATTVALALAILFFAGCVYLSITVAMPPCEFHMPCEFPY
jgi:hypothetical protein